MNNPNVIFAAVGMCEKQDALLPGGADRDKPILVQRMIWIVESQRERIVKTLVASSNDTLVS